MDRSYITARQRIKPGPILRWLDENDLLNGRMLDYGCGRGLEADYYDMHKYDPYYYPIQPVGKFDVIVCNYVLCVVPQEQEENILIYLSNKLKSNGTAFISVRRDIPKNYNKLTRYVELDLPIVKETSSFCIYEM